MRAVNTYIAVLSLLLSASGATAADYYVATNGNDTTGTGSEGNPWATIGKAMTSGLNAGDVIHVTTGTYRESNIGPTSGGTPGSPIRLVAEGEVTVTPADDATGSQIFYPLNNTAYNHWHVSGFTFRYHTTPGNGELMYARYDGARHWTFEDNTFQSLYGVWLGAADNDGIEFLENTYTNCAAVVTTTTGDNFVFSGNVVLDTSSGISLGAGQTNVTVSQNVFYLVGGVNVYVVGSTAADPTDRIRLLNNTFWRNDNSGEAIRTRYGDVDGLTDLLASNNLFVDYSIAHRNMGTYTNDTAYEFLYSNTTDYSGDWNSGTGDKTGLDPLFISTDPVNPDFLRFNNKSPAASGGNPAYAEYFGAVPPYIPPRGTMISVK
jgi:hypothetical protein